MVIHDAIPSQRLDRQKWTWITFELTISTCSAHFGTFLLYSACYNVAYIGPLYCYCRSSGCESLCVTLTRLCFFWNTFGCVFYLLCAFYHYLIYKKNFFTKLLQAYPRANFRQIVVCSALFGGDPLAIIIKTHRPPFLRRQLAKTLCPDWPQYKCHGGTSFTKRITKTH